MNKILLLLISIVLLFSCSKEVIEKPAPQLIQSCFYSDSHNLIQRADVELMPTAFKARQKPRFLSNVILLDFDGYTGSAQSAWGEVGTVRGAGLTQVQMQYIIDSIAYDFKDLPITVTTDENYYNLFPVQRRIRAVFTETNEWYGTRFGGVAYIGSFNWNHEEPCYIFTKLFKYNTKTIAEAGSHELGHTFGLGHQRLLDAMGVVLQEYYRGTGGIAPIMGQSYNAVGTWWEGAQQNDMAILKTTIK